MRTAATRRLDTRQNAPALQAERNGADAFPRFGAETASARTIAFISTPSRTDRVHPRRGARQRCAAP
jgi:hypothetical protein